MPDVSTVHFDAALTNVSIAYRNDGYIAPMIAPEVGVRRQSDRYFVYDAARDRFRQTADGRAPGAEAAEVDFQLSSDSYYCDDHALESAIPDEERDNADAPLRPEIDRAEFLTDRILLNQEIALAAKLLAPGVIPGADVADNGAWTHLEDGVPLQDIEAGRAAILSAVQALPNTLVLPFAVYTALRNHPTVTERVKYTGSGAVGTAALAELLDVERVLIARAVKNTAAPGQASAMAPVWGNAAILLHVPPRAGLKSVAAALTFAWTASAGARGVAVHAWREERRKATMIRVQKYYDQKIVAAGAAWVMRNAA